jgi:hypothetical protein
MRRQLALSLALVAVTCRWERPTCALPAVGERHREADNTPDFTLPDTGGFVVNGAPIARERIPEFLREVFAVRPPEARATFVWPAARQRCADVAFIAQAAQAAGGAAYDAARRGDPVVIPNRP